MSLISSKTRKVFRYKSNTHLKRFHFGDGCHPPVEYGILDIIAHIEFLGRAFDIRREIIFPEAHVFKIRHFYALERSLADRIEDIVIPVEREIHFLLELAAALNVTVVESVPACIAAEFPVCTPVAEFVSAFEAYMAVL